VDLGLSDEQAALRDLVASVLARECPTEVVRKHEGLGFSPELWARLASTGMPGLAIAEALGGSGRGLLDATLVAEEVGRRLAPVPLIEHLVALRLVERAGARRAWIADAAAGRSVVTLALHPAHGTATLVPAGAIAPRVVVWDEREQRLVVVGGEPPTEALPNLGGLPLADRAVDGPVDVLATGDEGRALHAAAVDEWRVLTAAALVGLASAALAMGVDYVLERHQFGVPIGSFQGVQHGLAELSGPVHGARLLAAKAAWLADHAEPQASLRARMAFVFAAELAADVTARALHYHGGYGVMEEYDIQLYYRRAKGWPQVLAGTAHECRQLAPLVLRPDAGG
jgi:alkylation response protein AidB-like acyl-CoA dehydrogenase